jgi:hypothetical protein
MRRGTAATQAVPHGGLVSGSEHPILRNKEAGVPARRVNRHTAHSKQATHPTPGTLASRKDRHQAVTCIGSTIDDTRPGRVACTPAGYLSPRLALGTWNDPPRALTPSTSFRRETDCHQAALDTAVSRVIHRSVTAAVGRLDEPGKAVLLPAGCAIQSDGTARLALPGRAESLVTIASVFVS